MIELPLLAIPFPRIDPVALEIGPVAIRWYALAYVIGLLFAWWYGRRLATDRPAGREILTRRDADDLLFWCTLGVILGGRIGYVLFYKPVHYLQNPGEILALWQGGMAFHGGLLGVLVAIVVFALIRKRSILSIGDIAACVAPVGLLLGRIANFINGELWGRVSEVPWAMIFPAGGPLPRHPSQLYEAFLEGLVLFIFLLVWRRRTNALDRPGELTGLFLIGYGVARFIVEFFRQPDAFLPNQGYLFGFVTMGQLLSLPLILLGLYLLVRARNRARASATADQTPGA